LSVLPAGEQDTQTGGESRSFPTTSTCLIRGLLRPGTPEFEAAARAYWKPIYCLIRVASNGGVEEAKDLTQQFFAEVFLQGSVFEKYDAERGGFRPFLKTYVRNFVRSCARAASRQKRGGGSHGRKKIDLSMADPPDPKGLTPDEAFDRAWAEAVLSRAQERFETRLRAHGREDTLRVFRLYELDSQTEKKTYDAVAATLGMSRDDVKNRLTRAREEYKRAVIEAVSEYAESPDALAAEMRELFGI
jgi:RNA polymerase sigma-70 factor (ECF subfamily)